MELIDLYRIQSKSFKSDLKKEEIKTELINGFNLSRKRNFKTLFQKECSDYQGSITNFDFKIRQNNALSSINDGLYFFFTQVSGEISDNGNERIIKISAELNQAIIGLILGSSPIYILILIFGSLSLGIACFLFLIFIYFYGRKNVKSDFEIFKKEFREKITVNNMV